jgi:hypothetical protein
MQFTFSWFISFLIDDISTACHIASNGKKTVRKELERMRKEAAVTSLKILLLKFAFRNSIYCERKV